MDKKRVFFSHRLLHLLSGLFLVVSIVVFLVLGIYAQGQDLKETYFLAQEAAEFLKNECVKYEKYNQGLSARALQDLLDSAKGLRDFIEPVLVEDDEFLNTFIRTEHVGGVMIMDRNLSLVTQANMDQQQLYETWLPVLKNDYIENIIENPRKSFVGNITLEGIPYDYAVIASQNGERLILCYSSTIKPTSDPYEYTMKSVLNNISLHKNPTIVITDGTRILSTNDPDLEKMDNSAYQTLRNLVKWKKGALTHFKYSGNAWYGIQRVYGSYYVYAVYPEEQIFANRTNYIVYGFMVYLVVCLILLSIQRYLDRQNLKRMKKQLGIIEAISTSYLSTLLLHLDRMELEAVKPSSMVKQVMEEFSSPQAVLECICRKYVAPEYWQQIFEFLEFSTIAERLRNRPYLEIEVCDRQENWYSILLIPQSFGSDGMVQAVLVATRDVSAVKRAEELSFKDKLTGLNNRNYMESQVRPFIDEKDYPVTLIMADCNYLKRTNDKLGHEYGDLLLKRIADVIRECLPENGLAMRVGGDEFLIVCKQCAKEDAEQLIVQIKEKLVESSDETLMLSVSFGCCTMKGNTMSFQEAYEQADQAMYREKQASKATRD